MKDDVRHTLRAVWNPGADLDPRIERLATITVGALVLAGAIGTYLVVGLLISPTPADAGPTGTVITPSTTSRQ